MLQSQKTLELPANTDFVSIRILAFENVYEDATGVEFDGHYADGLSMTIVPEPGTFLLVAMGGAAFLRKRRR